MKKIILYVFQIVFAVVCISCSTKKEEIHVGVDPTFFPLQIQGKEANVTGYFMDLFRMLGKECGMQFVTVDANWDTLVWGLQNEKYELVITAAQPTAINQQQFEFSEKILASGPVLIIPSTSSARGISDLNGIILIDGSRTAEILTKGYPEIIVRNYNSVGEAFNQIHEGKISGALVESLVASSYIRDMYPGEMKIATAPLTPSGFRFASRKNEKKELIERINQGIRSLEKEGILEDLQQKWSLSPSPRRENERCEIN